MPSPLFCVFDTGVPRVSRRAEESQAWAAPCRGPSGPLGPAQQHLSEMFSIYYLLFEIKNGLKNVWMIKLVPNLLKQNLLGSLSPDLLGKIVHVIFDILFYRILFNLEYC